MLMQMSVIRESRIDIDIVFEDIHGHSTKLTDKEAAQYFWWGGSSSFNTKYFSLKLAYISQAA